MLGGIGKERLDEHLIVYHTVTGRNVICECDVNIVNRVGHISEKHVVKLFSCDTCVQYFQTIKLVEEHVVWHLLVEELESIQ